MHSDSIEALGAAQYAKDDLVQSRARGEQKLALHGPGGDFDEGARGEVT